VGETHKSIVIVLQINSYVVLCAKLVSICRNHSEMERVKFLDHSVVLLLWGRLTSNVI